MDKNKRISATMRDTFERRRHQRCRVLELKVNGNRLNNDQLEHLNMLFVESKWCYNYLLDKMKNKSFDLFRFDPRLLDEITHKDKDGNDVTVNLSYITSSLKASLVTRLQSQIKTLRTLKKKGRNVGRLQFKSDYNGIIFKQYGVTHKIVSHNRIRIQGIRKPLPVNGLKQLDRLGSYELANAVLCKVGEDFYIKLTVFTNRENNTKTCKNKQIGIDFGCQTALTLSDGTKYNATVEESGRLKHLQRRALKQTKGSNNRRKTLNLIQKEYRKISNKKADLTNKIVHRLLEDNEQIIIQDEQLNAWKVKHGRKIQHGILGRIKSKLKEHGEAVIVLDRFIPTTKFCFECGHMHTDIGLFDREFVCPTCGRKYDRDVHAAMNMVWIYNNLKDKIGLDESEFKRAEFDEEVRRIFCGHDNQTSNHEDASSLG